MFDVHFHWMPPDMLERAREANPTHVILRRPFEFIDDNLAMLERNGVQKSLVSYTAFLDLLIAAFPGTRTEAFRAVNEKAADLSAKYPGRLLRCAAIDVMAGEAAVPELEYAVKDLGCAALEMRTSYPENDDTIFPHDRRFWPIYKKAEELGIAVFMHPGRPNFWKKLPEVVHFMGNDWGFFLGNQLAINLLAYGGVFDAFPRLPFILCQLGGFVPFAMGRSDLAYKRDKKFGNREMTSPDLTLVNLRDYVGRFYVDNHSTDSVAIRCAHETLGTGSLLFGSDCPIAPPVMGTPWHLEQVRGAELGDEAFRAMTWDNAAKLFDLDAQ